MSQLIITDLNFFKAVFPEKICLSGGLGNLTPAISTDLNTSLDTKIVTGSNVSGNLTDGFGLNLLGSGSGAAAAASASAVNGKASAFAFARS